MIKVILVISNYFQLPIELFALMFRKLSNLKKFTHNTYIWIHKTLKMSYHELYKIQVLPPLLSLCILIFFKYAIGRFSCIIYRHLECLGMSTTVNSATASSKYSAKRIQSLIIYNRIIWLNLPLSVKQKYKQF